MKWMQNLSLKYKMPVLFTCTLIVLCAVSYMVIFQTMKADLQANVERELDQTTSQITSMIRVAGETSIRNNLRSMASTNLNFIRCVYDKAQSGKMTMEEAKLTTVDFLLDQKVGSSGYLYVLDSDGVILHHPSFELIGVDLSEYEFIQKQLTLEEQYIQYDWKNPDDSELRPKALYMTYFEPWDWIISVSSYRDEFTELIQVEDFERELNALVFGETGYSYVLDLEGNVLIHPFSKGENLKELSGGAGQVLFDSMIEKKSGILTYEWSNEIDETPREKIAVINYIPEYEWIVASSGYTEEFYRSVERARSVLLMGFFMLSLTGIVAIGVINRSILYPVNELIEKVHEGSDGDLTVHLDWEREDEFGVLAKYFNTFIESLNAYRASREILIDEKQHALEQVKVLNDNLEDKVNDRTCALKDSLEELKETQQQLVHMEKMSTAGQVVSGMAHRLNTPLGTAITMVSFLSKELKKSIADYETGKMTEEDLFVAFQSAETGLKMTERNLSKSAELIEVMKSVAGMGKKGDASEFLMSEVLSDCISLFPSQMKSGKYAISVTCPEELTLVTARHALVQVFTNLISNSFKHGFGKQENGQINIAIHEKNDSVEILFTDDGKGMEPEYLEHVFDPFYRFDTIAKGVGLGLYIVHTAVVNGLGGRIDCDSSVGRGTKYRINLPKQNFK